MRGLVDKRLGAAFISARYEDRDKAAQDVLVIPAVHRQYCLSVNIVHTPRAAFTRTLLDVDGRWRM